MVTRRLALTLITNERAMSFKKGENVFITSLRRDGVISGVLKDGKYQVSVGPLSVTCSESDLSAPPKTRKSKSYVKPPPKNHPALNPVSNPKSLERVDLHGFKVVDALAEVEKRIDRAIIADLDRLEIVHGIGTGKLLDAIHKYLSKLTVVSSFKLDEVNPGVTWVYF